MSAQVYQLLHFVGLILLFSGIGSLLASYNKVGVALHGSGLVILLVSGFGMAAKLGLGFPAWMIAKLVIWLLLGAVIVVAKRDILPKSAAWVVVILLGAGAACLGLFKPF